MKFLLAALIALLITVCGCASKKPAPVKATSPQKTAAVTERPPEVKAVADGKKAEAETKLIVTPEAMLVGTVATFNTAGRFVVLDFAVGKLPAADQTMFLYRQGLKVGEVKITGPERDHNTVADLISGEARKGDEVRDR